jgi:hypothetical protein
MLAIVYYGVDSIFFTLEQCFDVAGFRVPDPTYDTVPVREPLGVRPEENALNLALENHAQSLHRTRLETSP